VFYHLADSSEWLVPACKTRSHLRLKERHLLKTLANQVFQCFLFAPPLNQRPVSCDGRKSSVLSGDFGLGGCLFNTGASRPPRQLSAMGWYLRRTSPNGSALYTKFGGKLVAEIPAACRPLAFILAQCDKKKAVDSSQACFRWIWITLACGCSKLPGNGQCSPSGTLSFCYFRRIQFLFSAGILLRDGSIFRPRVVVKLLTARKKATMPVQRNATELLVLFPPVRLPMVETSSRPEAGTAVRLWDLLAFSVLKASRESSCGGLALAFAPMGRHYQAGGQRRNDSFMPTNAATREHLTKRFVRLSFFQMAEWLCAINDSSICASEPSGHEL